MNVLMLSGDKKMFTPGSEANRRFELQRAEVGRLDVLAYQGFWSGPIGVLEVLYIALTGRYDVITVQEPFWRALLGWVAARFSGARLNIQVHVDLKIVSGSRHILAQILLRHADTIRVVSERIRAQVQALGTRARIDVLPVFVDVTRFQNLKHNPQKEKIILWLGRLEDEKDPLLAIEVLRQVRAGGVDARLVLLGSGTLGPALHDAAVGLPIDMPGWQDPQPYLEMADVVLSTSKSESWGASIVEALAAGVPVVAPDVGIAKEYGAHIAERGALASAVVEVLNSGEKGKLLVALPAAAEWAKKWRETLV